MCNLDDRRRVEHPTAVLARSRLGDDALEHFPGVVEIALGGVPVVVDLTLDRAHTRAPSKRPAPMTTSTMAPTSIHVVLPPGSCGICDGGAGGGADSAVL